MIIENQDGNEVVMDDVLREGVVTSCIPEKGFGFIRDDDGNDYYFKIKDVAGGEAPRRGFRVSFDPMPTPRGYSASKITLAAEPMEMWVNPDRVMVSEQSQLPDAEIIYTISHKIWANSHNHDEARQNLIELALDRGCNGVVNLRSYSIGAAGGTQLEGDAVYVQLRGVTYDMAELEASKERVTQALTYINRIDVECSRREQTNPVHAILGAVDKFLGFVRKLAFSR